MEKLKLIIVDDSLFMRELLKNILKEEKRIEIIGEAYDGYSAINAAKKKPDIMTLDITMDNLSGLDALPEILKISNNTKIIIVSAISKRKNIINAIKNGAIGFISKPFVKEKILYEVNNCINIIENENQ